MPVRPVFGAITGRTIAILAVTHVHHFYLHIRLLYLPQVVTLLLTGPGGALSYFTLSFPFETFAVAFVLAVVGDVDHGGGFTGVVA
jgi:hypothetical protein